MLSAITSDIKEYQALLREIDGHHMKTHGAAGVWCEHASHEVVVSPNTLWESSRVCWRASVRGFILDLKCDASIEVNIDGEWETLHCKLLNDDSHPDHHKGVWEDTLSGGRARDFWWKKDD